MVLQRDFSHVKVGDIVLRMLSGVVPMKLKVSEVTDTLILCGPKDVGWAFERRSGAEVDEELGWGIRDENDVLSRTGSFLVPYEHKEEVEETGEEEAEEIAEEK